MAYTIDRATKHLLLVEDSPTQASQLNHLLGKQGYTRVTVLHDAEEALDWLEEHQPDAIVSDVVMPETTGFELCAMVKQDPDWGHIPVVLLTTQATLEDATVGMTCGADSYLIKPPDPHDLAARLDALLAAAEPLTASGPSDAQVGGYSGRVLLVEDNLINRHVVIGHLREIGITDVDVAENGALGVEKAAATDYALILMDLQMPVMDGYAATEQIRAQETGHRARIVALTADAIPGARERCFALGMDDFATKPFKLQKIRDLMDQWMPRQVTAPAAPSVPILALTPDAEQALKQVIQDPRTVIDKWGGYVFTDLVHVLTTDMPQRLRSLERQWAQGNTTALSNSLKNVREGLSLLGLTRLLEGVDALQLAASREPVASKHHALHTFVQQYEAAESHLKQGTQMMRSGG